MFWDRLIRQARFSSIYGQKLVWQHFKGIFESAVLELRIRLQILATFKDQFGNVFSSFILASLNIFTRPVELSLDLMTQPLFLENTIFLQNFYPLLLYLNLSFI